MQFELPNYCQKTLEILSQIKADRFFPLDINRPRPFALGTSIQGNSEQTKIYFAVN